MKYGLMYYKSTDNIGDDIQTYAAKKYLPQIDYYIDRESLSCFIPKEKEYVSMIMNGWYIHNKIAWPPSPYINPLLISMHFKDLADTDVGDAYLKNLGGEFLKKYGPVGARDKETLNRLQKNGIDSYLSGCMTLTIEKFDRVQKKDKIILADVDKDIIEKVKENTDYKIEIVSHLLNPEETEKKTIEQRMNDVETLLKKYQESHLVITTRLHVMLPCIALGTPVILLHKGYYDKDRLDTFLDWVDNYVDEDFLSMDIKDILKNPKENSNQYLKTADFINQKCKEFIEKVSLLDAQSDWHLKENNRTGPVTLEKLEIENLPEIEDYKQYVKNIQWYKDIYERERLTLERVEKTRVKEFQNFSQEIQKKNLENEKLNQTQNQLEMKINDYKNKIQDLEEELYKIYSSKGWRYLEKARKILKST